MKFHCFIQVLAPNNALPYTVAAVIFQKIIIYYIDINTHYRYHKTHNYYRITISAVTTINNMYQFSISVSTNGY